MFAPAHDVKQVCVAKTVFRSGPSSPPCAPEICRSECESGRAGARKDTPVAWNGMNGALSMNGGYSGQIGNEGHKRGIPVYPPRIYGVGGAKLESQILAELATGRQGDTRRIRQLLVARRQACSGDSLRQLWVAHVTALTSCHAGQLLHMPWTFFVGPLWEPL